MRLTESQLRRIIREEKLRITPVRRGQLMSEQRADYLAQEVLEEGLFGNLGAALKAGAGEAKKMLGGAASSFISAVGAELKGIATPFINAKKAAETAAGKITDKMGKAWVDNAAASMQGEISKLIAKATADSIQKLVKTGKSEEEAKAETAGYVTTALALAVGNATASSGGGK